MIYTLMLISSAFADPTMELAGAARPSARLEHNPTVLLHLTLLLASRMIGIPITDKSAIVGKTEKNYRFRGPPSLFSTLTG